MQSTVKPKILLVKPPEKSSLNFGTFSLGVLGAAASDIADISVIDATHKSPVETAAFIAKAAPDMVGITLMGLESVEPGIRLLKTLRTQYPDSGLQIITGGHGASMLPDDVLDAGADCVVLGEGETTFRELVQQGIRPGMAGTVTRSNGKIVRGAARPLIAPLDKLPFPARHLIPPPPNGVYLMETSRGCPHQCKFCHTTRFFGRRWRPMSPQRVVDEARMLIDEHDAWIIHFADDNFSANVKRVKQICEQIIGDEVFPAFYMVSARADDLVSDPELLPLMAEARMLRVSVGVETLNSDVAAEAGKPITMGVYKEAFSRMRELGIYSIASLIVGLPGETEETRDRTVELCIEAGPDTAHFLPFQPQPGINISGCEDLKEFDCNPRDIADAYRFNKDYFLHPTVQERLKTLAAKGGVVGTMAAGALKNPRYKQLEDSTR